MNEQVIILGEILLAALLGGLVGLEREFARKPAGLRTHMLVAICASFLVALGRYVVTDLVSPDVERVDPIRIIEAVIVGVSFLGAGTILRVRGGSAVEGLTTSASVLSAAAIGIGCALGLVQLTIAVTLVVLFVNRGLNPVERWLQTRVIEQRVHQTDSSSGPIDQDQ
ncbi:MAG: MgtC/SapB family protein [Anaerolineales bacterium]|jgi:putative Mg2+ transporter-C (MgtC) family protein